MEKFRVTPPVRKNRGQSRPYFSKYAGSINEDRAAQRVEDELRMFNWSHYVPQKEAASFGALISTLVHVVSLVSQLLVFHVHLVL